MNNLPNDERQYRNQQWYERVQQQPPYNHRPRVAPDVRDTLNDATIHITHRPTTACLPEHPRRGQGRGRSGQNTPNPRLSHPDGDCIETDGDMDDTLSEFAGGWYSPRRHRAHSTTMRPSTWKKLNQWLDAHQQVRNEGMEKVQSMTELRFAEYLSSEEEEQNEPVTMQDGPETVKHKNAKQELDEANKEPASDAPQETHSVLPEAQPSKCKSIGLGYQLLKNLMMLLLYIIESVAPLTFPLLTFLKDHMKTGIVYLWVRFLQPIAAQGTLARADPLSVVMMLLVLPLLALLGVGYCVVCILYWVHRLFLIEH